ncbi:MAG: hypothetical protein WA946_15585 [Nitrospirota bacterium]
MKKIILLFVAMMLMVSFAGQAMAAFDEGDLIRVVYSGTGAGTEYATDLGAFSASAPLTTNVAFNTDTFSLSKLGSGATLANTNVAYFILSNTANGGNGSAYASGPANAGNINPYAFWGSFSPAAGSTLDTYRGAAVGNNATVAQTGTYSYWNMMNGGGTMIGTMGNYLASGDAEKNLGALATSSYVDQVLYYYGSDPSSGAQGTSIATIRTFADGSTQLVAQATPIPAAIYLFGSGLMGLVGLRRKTVA